DSLLRLGNDDTRQQRMWRADKPEPDSQIHGGDNLASGKYDAFDRRGGIRHGSDMFEHFDVLDVAASQRVMGTRQLEKNVGLVSHKLSELIGRRVNSFRRNHPDYPDFYTHMKTKTLGLN